MRHIRVDLAKFADLIEEFTTTVGWAPTPSSIHAAADCSADQPFNWTPAHERFFVNLAEQIQRDGKASCTGEYQFTEAPEGHSSSIDFDEVAIASFPTAHQFWLDTQKTIQRIHAKQGQELDPFIRHNYEVMFHTGFKAMLDVAMTLSRFPDSIQEGCGKKLQEEVQTYFRKDVMKARTDALLTGESMQTLSQMEDVISAIFGDIKPPKPDLH